MQAPIAHGRKGRMDCQVKGLVEGVRSVLNQGPNQWWRLLGPGEIQDNLENKNSQQNHSLTLGVGTQVDTPYLKSSGPDEKINGARAQI